VPMVDDTFTVEMEYSTMTQVTSGVDVGGGTPGAASPVGSLEPLPRSPTPASAGAAGNDNWEEQLVSPQVMGEEDLDTDHDEDAPLRLRVIDDILGPTPPPGLARQVLTQELNAVSSDEPNNFDEAQQYPCWRRAMLEEMQTIEDNQTWCLEDLLADHRAIGLKWVFKVKRDDDGNNVKHKAGLVVKGYAQRRGLDYDEVFALVARLDSVRLLIALAAHEGWEVHHLDVKSAFLNGDLHEEVYVEQPLGFIKEGEEHKVLKLKKALYGLHQAPRAWNEKVDDTLMSFGFNKCPSEPAIYTRHRGKHQLVVGVYVDDLMVTGSSIDGIKQFKIEMVNAFKMSDLGLLHYYLGIEVRQSFKGIALCQKAYAEKIVEMCGLQDCNSNHTPMESRLKLSKQSFEPVVDNTLYRCLVGSLRYLMNT
jgi:hypothetical protein